MMNDDFRAAMTQATATVRGGDPLAATRMIQAALAGNPGTTAAASPATGPAGPGLLPKVRRVYDKLRRKPQPEPTDKPRIRPGRHDTPQGSRAYRLFVPTIPPADGRGGLVVMLHGCTQTPESFATGTRMNALAGALGLHVLWPEQPRNANRMRCWNWFEPDHHAPGAGESAILTSMVRAIAQEHDIPRNRVYVAGMSAGGAMAEVLIAADPDLFAAAGIHSGVPAGLASSVPDAMALMQKGPAAEAAPSAPGNPGSGPRRIVFHGDADTTVHPGNGAAIAAMIGLGRVTEGTTNGRAWTRRTGPRGEYWLLHGGGHAWAGGDPAGTHTEAAGPDASAEMLRFFRQTPEGAS